MIDMSILVVSRLYSVYIKNRGGQEVIINCLIKPMYRCKVLLNAFHFTVMPKITFLPKILLLIK